MTFLPSLLTSSLFRAKLVGLIGICSLSCSAFALIAVPTTKPVTNEEPSHGITYEKDSGPLRKYVLPMNGALSLLIGLNSLVFYGKRGVHEGFWILCLIPAGELTRNGRDIKQLVTIVKPCIF